LIALALDGPFNGQYISNILASMAGYSLEEWPTGEQVWFHTSGTMAEPSEELFDVE
jgi:hypothetical protein